MSLPSSSKVPKAIVFDLDGTLVDSGDQVMAAFRYALAPFEIEVTVELLESVRSRNQNNLFEGILKNEDGLIAVRRLSEHSNKSAAEVSLYPGLSSILKLLKDRGVPVAIWTGRDALSAAQIISSLDLNTHFGRLVAGCDVAKNKPHPEGLLKLVNHFKCGPDDVLMIGDHEHDIVGAKQAGCRSALAFWNGRKDFSGEKHGADLVFSSTDDLLEYFRNVFLIKE